MRDDAERHVITGFGVFSPLGIGWEEFSAGVRSGRRGHLVAADNPAEPLPFSRAFRVPAYDPAAYLGGKGWRHLCGATIMTFCTVEDALRHARYEVTADVQTETAVILGTSTGSLERICESGRDTYRHEKPYLLSVKRGSVAVLNGIGSHVAIWRKTRGVNATVSAGRLSSLTALRYAHLALRARRARACLVGGVEYLSTPVAWMRYHSEQLAGPVDLEAQGYLPGEGCVMALLENLAQARQHGRRPLVEVVDCRTGFAGSTEPYAPADVQGRALADLIAAMLERGGVDRDAVAVVAVGNHSAMYRDDPALLAVEQVFGRAPRVLRIHEQVGETYCASGAMQLAAAAALLDAGGRSDGAWGIVTSVDPQGGIGCALIRAWRD